MFDIRNINKKLIYVFDTFFVRIYQIKVNFFF